MTTAQDETAARLLPGALGVLSSTRFAIASAGAHLQQQGAELLGLADALTTYLETAAGALPGRDRAGEAS